VLRDKAIVGGTVSVTALGGRGARPWKKKKKKKKTQTAKNQGEDGRSNWGEKGDRKGGTIVEQGHDYCSGIESSWDICLQWGAGARKHPINIKKDYTRLSRPQENCASLRFAQKSASIIRAPY